MSMVGIGCEEMVLKEEEIGATLQEGNIDKVIQSFLKCMERLSKASGIYFSMMMMYNGAMELYCC